METNIIGLKSDRGGQISIDALLAILGLLILLYLLSSFYNLNNSSETDVKDIYVAKMIAISLASQFNTAVLSLVNAVDSNVTTNVTIPNATMLQNISYTVSLGDNSVSVSIDAGHKYTTVTFLNCQLTDLKPGDVIALDCYEDETCYCQKT